MSCQDALVAGAPKAPVVTGFSLVSELEEGLAAARWSPSEFACDQALLDYAEMLVALGEVVAHPGGENPIEATTDPERPIPLALTLIHAGGRVLYFSLVMRADRNRAA